MPFVSCNYSESRVCLRVLPITNVCYVIGVNGLRRNRKECEYFFGSHDDDDDGDVEDGTLGFSCCCL